VKAVDLTNNKWFERYRPRVLEDLIVDEPVRREIQKYIESGEIPHLLLAGSPGIGKTTLAQIIAEAIDADLLFINASSSNGIGVVRDKIEKYCSVRSLGGKPKIVQLEEGDRLTPEAQDALRPVFEEFSKWVTFIITCNQPDRISEAIKSRCTPVSLVPRDVRETKKQIAIRCAKILKMNEIEFENDALKAIVNFKFPDMRSIMNQLQRAAAKGKVDSEAVAHAKATSLDSLFEHIRNNKYSLAVEWISDNVNDAEFFITQLWNNVRRQFVVSSIAEASIYIDDAQERLARVPDKNITLFAMIAKIMSNCKMKPAEEIAKDD
jgi:DNA polymerase III delta prime subunit